MDSKEKRLVVLWIVLVALTGISFGAIKNISLWYLGEGMSGAFVLCIAFIKVRIVIIYFMDIKIAPWILRVLMELWIFGVCVLLVTLNFKDVVTN